MEEQKQTAEQDANEIYGVLRGIKLMSNGQGLNADEHDAVKQRMEFLLSKAKEAEILQGRVKDLELLTKKKK